MTDDDPFAPAEPEVMAPAAAKQLYASPHVHTPDGTCVRNRFKSPCSAPTKEGNARD